ncbi:MAG: IS66 family transposase [Limisphaerales bacterium]
MKITSHLFETFLKCATKCHFRSLGETGSGNEYPDWVRAQDESYQREAARRLQGAVPETERVVAPPATENLKAAKWRLAVDLLARTSDRSADSHVRESRSSSSETSELGDPPSEQLLESRLHAAERAPSEGQGKPAQFVPIRFVFRNKLTKDDRLLLAFDALVLSQVLGRQVCHGKIIHGDDHATLKVRTTALFGEVRKRLEKIAALLSSATPPDLVLNRHCAECEFQARCRQKALETDDLSLLGGMKTDERKEYRSKGIFTVTQLSYTFRPRRRPKKLRDKREKYHHSLKALAIREKKTYVVGSPEMKIEGTLVYLDVEALPDLDFYYLIGARVKTAEGFIHHNFWADDINGMARIWTDFLNLLAALYNPCLIHYGRFETTFLNRMCARFGGPSPDAVGVIHAIEHSVNLLSIVYAQVYFATFSNGLKEIAVGLGFKWSETNASGSRSVLWRHAWNGTKDTVIKSKLITYNAEDCEALSLVERVVSRLANRSAQPDAVETQGTNVVRTDDLKDPLINKWREFSSPLSELEFVTNAAHWDYQRDRIYVRSSKRLKRARRNAKATPKSVWRVDKVIKEQASTKCPRCQRNGSKHGTIRSRTVQEVIFGRFSLKRRVIRYDFQPYWCSNCKGTFGVDEKLLKRGKRAKYGRSLLAYFFHQVMELGIPMRVAAESMSRLFGLSLNTGTFAFLKLQMADYYSQTHQQILKRIVSGGLVHADETHANIKGKRAYVWVFTNMHEVAYLYSDSREGELAQTTLAGFKGVLVSDFYAVYDSFGCPQQKCLIHLVRDLNGAMLDNPYDEEMKHIVTSFGQLLKTIIEDVDRRGLKKHFFRKHVGAVMRFYRKVVVRDYQSPVALTCVERFEKNRDTLFTFLNCDGVPWNNNNAEHAIKAFARLRELLGGSSTEKGIREYLILLSLCQTCKYMGVDFLNFLRSGEKDIHAFAESRRGRRRRTQTSQPPGLSAAAIPDTGSQP